MGREDGRRRGGQDQQDRGYKDRGPGQARGPRNQREPQLRQTMAPKLRQALSGPQCLRCGRPVDLKRQASGQGWLHDSCEQAMLPEVFVEMLSGIDFGEDA